MLSLKKKLFTLAMYTQSVSDISITVGPHEYLVLTC